MYQAASRASLRAVTVIILREQASRPLVQELTTFNCTDSKRCVSDEAYAHPHLAYCF